MLDTVSKGEFFACGGFGVGFRTRHIVIFWDTIILCKIFADVISVETGWWHLVVRQFELFTRRANILPILPQV